MDSYQRVADQVREGLNSNHIPKLDLAFASLVELSEEGLLASFVLISNADAGIAEDDPSDRDAHRDKVTPSIHEWIIHGAGAPAEPRANPSGAAPTEAGPRG